MWSPSICLEENGDSPQLIPQRSQLSPFDTELEIKVQLDHYFTVVGAQVKEAEERAKAAAMEAGVARI